MARWKSDNFAWTRHEADGAIRGSVYYMKDGKSRRDLICAGVKSPVFPTIERSDFTSMQAAKEWADKFIDPALELLHLRETVKIKQEEASA